MLRLEPARTVRIITGQARRFTMQPRKTRKRTVQRKEIAACTVPVHCPIVALGASAGGLEVFGRFFDRMPPDTGFAFVVVQHLDPSHDTLMPELLSKHTAMKVVRVENGMKLEANQVYVIAPNGRLRMESCTLLVDPLFPGGDAKVIDEFFRSVAEDQKQGVVGIIFSGNGSDGTLGLKAIKEHGGFTIAQSPARAKFDAMPRSAISAGFVDLVLEVEEMPARVLEFIQHVWNVQRRKGAEVLQQEIMEHLPKIATLLRKRTGHDFSLYKQSTLVRRIQRRMQLLNLDVAGKYTECLKQSAGEIDSLFKDLLIGVTHFFRDPESFEFLAERVVPILLKDKTGNSPLRVWVPGCASGEEAFSIAILLLEQAEELRDMPKIQVFGTDLDAEALEVARKAKYPAEIAKQVSPVRLKRFFKRTGETYELIDAVRETCIFSPHNLIKDPPFSRLDLISCRNVLIYLEADLQKKLLPLFHYALSPSGYLFLGPSENVASRSELFRTIDPRHRIFQRKPMVLHSAANIPVIDPGQVTRLQAIPLSPPSQTAKEPNVARAIERLLIEEYAPASAIINEQGDVVYFAGDTGRFLKTPAGTPNNKLILMARENLRLELRTLIHRAISTGQQVTRENIRVKSSRDTFQIDLVVRPLTELGSEAGLYIVLFRELIPAVNSGTPAVEDFASHEHPIIKQLENELRTTREDLQTTIEELETSNEELKSANEELLSMNEELQSANEELQTSKEEVQSANDELQRKIAETDQANAELRRAHQERAEYAAIVQNSDDAIIGKNLDGVITSWNQAAERIFGYSAAEMIGQSILRIIPPEQHEEERRILDKLRRGESVAHYETQRLTKGGRRIQVSLTSSPIRDPEGFVVGASKIARDITAQSAAMRASMLLAAVVDSSDDAIVSKRLDGTITSWNKGAQRLFGYTAEEMIGQPITRLFPEDRLEEEPKIISRIASGERVEHFETVRRRKDGRLIDVSLTISPVLAADGTIAGASKIARDITERKRTEEQLRRNEEQLRSMADLIPQLAWMADAEGSIFWYNRGWYEYTGTTPEQMQGWGWQSVHDPKILPLVLERWRESLRTGNNFEMEFPLRGADGVFRWFLTRVNPMRDKEGRVVRWFGTNTNVDDARKVRQALEEQTRVLELLNSTGAAIASELKLERLVQTVTDAGTKLSGAKFGAFFYNVINEQGESFLLFTLSGAPREAFEKFGLPRNTPIFNPTFRGEGVVRCEDVTKDPRYGTMAPHFGMPKGHLPVRSYLAVPVISRTGEVIGGLFFGHPEPGVFSERSEQLIRGIAAQAAIAIDNARLFEVAQREIAQRKQTEAALQKSKDELEERVKERTASLQETTEQLETFCYTVAHDLRSPLRAQQSFAQALIQEFSGQLDQTGIEYAQRILRSAERLDALVRDLLSYARLSRDQLNFGSVALAGVVANFQSSHADEIQKHEATLSIGQLHCVLAYEPTLNLVVTNLITNALKFVKPNERPKIKIWSEQRGSHVRLWIEDNGIGIPAEAHARIFGVFQRLHPIDKYPGTGIGLAIVHKGIERMGGKVGLESTPGEGSRFWIELPAAPIISSASTA
jgi:two-component system CheB/CheR fusion protein